MKSLTIKALDRECLRSLLGKDSFDFFDTRRVIFGRRLAEASMRSLQAAANAASIAAALGTF